jgi:hypothetical protein
MTATSLDPEELAYPYGSLNQSRRRARVLCADGVVRKAIVGIPDTYFSIPARLKANGKTVSGFVSSEEVEGAVVYTFTAYTSGANHDAIKAPE